MILARAPLSLRSQVTRVRVASPARYVHGHGEYHVYFLCHLLCVSLIFECSIYPLRSREKNARLLALNFPSSSSQVSAFLLLPRRSNCKLFTSLSSLILLNDALCRKKSGAA